jgi:hypothetical protein
VIEPLTGPSEVRARDARETLPVADVGAPAVESVEVCVEEDIAGFEYFVEIGDSNRELIRARRECRVVHYIHSLQIAELVDDRDGGARAKD